jgi:membrane-associated phospholipid phosphatase
MMLVMLLISGAVLLWLPPPERDFDPDDWSINHQSRDSYVSGDMMAVGMIFVALVVVAYEQCCFRDPGRSLSVFMAYAYSLCLDTLFVTVIKVCTGRLRPNFMSHCDYDAASASCTASADSLHNSRLSFPSGHTANAFNAGMFLSFYLYEVLSPRKPGGRYPNGAHIRAHVTGLTTALCCAPVLIATITGISRTADYHHHPGDVVAGAILGIGTAAASFFVVLPAARRAYEKRSDASLV